MSLFDKPLVTFEMANNHQGDVEHGKRIIREIGAVAAKYSERFDFAFKFQYRDLDSFIHPDYKGREDIKNVKRFEDTRLTQDEFAVLMETVKENNMYTMCTPFDEVSAERIKEQGYDAIKIASCSFTDWPLLEAVAQTGLTVIASAAGAEILDIDKVVSFFEHRNIPMALMHCVAEYPTPNEHLQMNQIDLFRQRYPRIHIGFSTHESPDNMEPVMIAIAKGASIIERHVGVETDEITLNAYSSTPKQIDAWLEAAQRAYDMCGVIGMRYEPYEKELSDLAALQRGVYAAKDLDQSSKLQENDYYLAFPCQKGQLLAKDLSKYSAITLKDSVKVNEAIMAVNTEITNKREGIYGKLEQIVAMIKKSNVVIPRNSMCEISHHYGIDKYNETGLAMISVVNREYCKKILVLLPHQSHPVHLHKKKEETFVVLYGDLIVSLDDETRIMGSGDTLTVERGVGHSFSTENGCVFEEISTTHYADDSYYENADGFASPRKTTVYITEEMLAG